MMSFSLMQVSYRQIEQCRACRSYQLDVFLVPEIRHLLGVFAGRQDVHGDAKTFALDIIKESRWFTRGWTLQEHVFAESTDQSTLLHPTVY